MDKTIDIPYDYDGVTGVPITFLDKYNPEQFEILGIDRYIEGNKTPNKRFTINGKEIYARIVIRRIGEAQWKSKLKEITIREVAENIRR